MNLAEIKQHYGDRLCLIGNLDTSGTLATGSADDVEREALNCLLDAGPGGGYILAPDHSFHAAVPSQNIWRALQTCNEYGRYPLDRSTIQARLVELEGAS